MTWRVYFVTGETDTSSCAELVARWCAYFEVRRVERVS